TCPGKSNDPCERRVYFDASLSSDNDSTDGTNGIISYEWRIYSDRRYDQLPSGSPYHEYVRPTSDFTYAFKNVTADPTGNTAGTPIRMDLTVQDRANKDSEKYRLFFQIVPEDFGDAPPVVDILTPEEGDSQSGALVWINGTVSSGVEDGDLMIQVALSGSDLNLTPTQQFARKGAMKFNSTSSLGDGSNFQLALGIDDLYQVGEGVTQTVYIKIQEGSDGVAIYQQIQINLIPIEEETGDGGGIVVEPENTEGGSATNLLLIVAGLVFALVAIVGVTLLIMRSRGGDDAVGGGEQAVFGGVETMDPKEAYVQQLIAQGYPEETARAYAEQYASHFQQ
ncbi:MAG TPA: hypothetical protein QF555_03105, partial [Candidatus Thalassarchaeaceae archaeon]|nr:hypothetical protein [Candidatus Thalassarchaeaceae archaeon]